MKIRTIQILTVLLGIAFQGNSSTRLEWDRIANWTGEGENAAAIGIQFNDGTADRIYVYGYRWSGDAAPSCREIMRAICRGNNSLCMLEQRTSRADNGYHLGGIGFGAGNMALRSLYFDFGAALRDSKVGFNYYATDQSGNLIGPGDAMTQMCVDAIADALAMSHVVNHPVDASIYGAASFDYDHWKVDGIDADLHWNAGWNIGNWVMWTGNDEVTMMDYAGMGYGSHLVEPGEFIVWNFNRHDSYPSDRDPVDGYSGASRPARPLSYVPAETSTGVSDIGCDGPGYSIYTLGGLKGARADLPGFYIVRTADMRSRLVYLTPAMTQTWTQGYTPIR